MIFQVKIILKDFEGSEINHPLYWNIRLRGFVWHSLENTLFLR